MLRTPITVTFGGDQAAPFLQTQIGWVAAALGSQKSLCTPCKAFEVLAENHEEVTPLSERLVNVSMQSLLAPMPMDTLMDETDAKDILKHVVDKVVTRAAKRKAEAEAAAEAEEARLMAYGQAWAAKKRAIAARPVKSVRVVEPTGRVWYY